MCTADNILFTGVANVIHRLQHWYIIFVFNVQLRIRTARPAIPKEASFLVFGNDGKKFTSFQNKLIFLQGMKKYYRGIMENFPFSSLENSSVLGNYPVFLLCKNTVLYAGMRRIITSNRHPSFYFGENWKDPAIQQSFLNLLKLSSTKSTNRSWKMWLKNDSSVWNLFASFRCFREISKYFLILINNFPIAQYYFQGIHQILVSQGFDES